jgi:hypothetical protein
MGISLGLSSRLVLAELLPCKNPSTDVLRLGLGRYESRWYVITTRSVYA